METDALKLVRAKLRERMNALADDVATGAARDFAEYRNLCGVIHGLALAEREVLDLLDIAELEDR